MRWWRECSREICKVSLSSCLVCVTVNLLGLLTARLDIMKELDDVDWDPWELSCVLQPGHYEWTGICVSSLLFLRTINALSRGSSKDKLTKAFACGKPIIFCAYLTHLFTFYSLHPHEHL